VGDHGRMSDPTFETYDARVAEGLLAAHERDAG